MSRLLGSGCAENDSAIRRKVLVGAIAVVLIAIALNYSYEGITGSVEFFDRFSLPVLAAWLLALGIFGVFWPNHLRAQEFAAFGGIAAYVLGKLVYFSLDMGVEELSFDLVGGTFWLFPFFVFAFLIFGPRLGLAVAAGGLLAVLGVGIAHFVIVHSGSPHWDHLWLFVQLLFAGGLFLALAALQTKLQALHFSRAEALTSHAFTDFLTEVSNRRHLNQVLAAEVARVKRYEKHLSIILLDVDRFKAINDTYGHQIGDTLLKEFARLLSREVRTIDFVGRWGGEEFLVVLPETGEAEALVLAERLKLAVERESFSSHCRASASFGVATLQPSESVDELLTRADRALYRAKAGGRNRVETA